MKCRPYRITGMHYLLLIKPSVHASALYYRTACSYSNHTGSYAASSKQTYKVLLVLLEEAFWRENLVIKLFLNYPANNCILQKRKFGLMELNFNSFKDMKRIKSIFNQ